jgi:hypothetical protein
MEDNFKSENCNQHEALSFKDNVFKVSKLQETLKTVFCNDLANVLREKLKSYGVDINPGGYMSGNKFYSYTYSKFFQEGIECEILKFNSEEWQKGKMKIKVTLEFCPDEPDIKEPESPLDDLRRKINEATS